MAWVLIFLYNFHTFQIRLKKFHENIQNLEILGQPTLKISPPAVPRTLATLELEL